MKGDYHRYLAEFAAGDTRKTSSEAAHESYKTASAIASSELAPTRKWSRSSLHSTRRAGGCIWAASSSLPLEAALLQSVTRRDRRANSPPSQTPSASDSPSTSPSSTTRLAFLSSSDEQELMRNHRSLTRPSAPATSPRRRSTTRSPSSIPSARRATRILPSCVPFHSFCDGGRGADERATQIMQLLRDNLTCVLPVFSWGGKGADDACAVCGLQTSTTWRTTRRLRMSRQRTHPSRLRPKPPRPRSSFLSSSDPRSVSLDLPHPNPTHGFLQPPLLSVSSGNLFDFSLARQRLEFHHFSSHSASSPQQAPSEP